MTTLRITGGKGFHLSFDNGVTMSVQIGGGNYGDNYDFPIGGITYENPLPASSCAEIGIWPREGEWVNLNSPDEDYENNVAGYVPVGDVFGIVPTLSALPDGATTEAIETALIDFRKSNR